MTVITASGRQRSVSGVPEKNNGGGGLPVADGQAASVQIEEIQWAVGGPLVKPSARWATTSPLTTAAAASGSSVDSQTISGGPPLTRQLMYGSGWDGAIKPLVAHRGRTVRDGCSQWIASQSLRPNTWGTNVDYLNDL